MMREGQRQNAYAGICHLCHKTVPPLGGIIFKKPRAQGKGWLVECGPELVHSDEVRLAAHCGTATLAIAPSATGETIL